MSRLIHQPDRETLRRLQSDYRARRHAGVGGKCSPATSLGGRPQTDPRCWDITYLACCKTVISRAANGVAAGTAVTIQLEPENFPYAKACAVAIEVVDAADPSLRSSVRLSDVQIQGCPQLGIRNGTPAAGDTDYMRTTTFDPLNRNGCACPVGWGTFSNNALSYPLEAIFFNDNPGAVDIVLTAFVDGRSEPPKDCECGRDNGMAPPPVITYGATPGRGSVP